LYAKLLFMKTVLLFIYTLSLNVVAQGTESPLFPVLVELRQVFGRLRLTRLRMERPRRRGAQTTGALDEEDFI
jgi:hypothetical protein